VLVVGTAGTLPAVDGASLVYGKSQPAIALDPGVVDEGGSSPVISQVFDSLLTYEPGGTKIIPALAERYTVSDDGLEITFFLRKGVKFHDGTAMNADAVVFSLARQHFKDHPFNKFGPWKYWDTSGFKDIFKKDGSLKQKGVIKDIRKVDDYTVKIFLNEPDAALMVNFALYFTSIVSPAAAEKYGEDFKKNPVGSGPFKFVKWVKDDYVMLERFDAYWGEQAGVQRLIFKVYPDPTARAMALRKGEADIIDPPDADNLRQLMQDPNIKVEFKEGLTMGYLCMNVERKPFDSKLVRQAINYAVNKEEIIKAVYGDLGSVAAMPMPPSLWGFNTDIKPYSHDPAKARELLKQAGYPNGFSCELFALPVSRPYNPDGRKVGEILQAQLKQVGVDAKITSYDIGTYWDKVDAGEFDICMTGWSGEPDPNDWLFRLFTAGYLNSARWKNEPYTELVTRARTLSDIDKRAALYKQAQVILNDEAPIVMLAYGVLAAPMRKNVENFIIYPTNKLVLRHVRIQ
jgi:peptide/nickel transport system substrate-binding protein